VSKTPEFLAHENHFFCTTYPSKLSNMKTHLFLLRTAMLLNETISGIGKQVKFTDPRQPLVPFKRNFYRVKVVD